MFKPGQITNPLGRPKAALEIQNLARQHGPAGIAKLAEMAGLAPGKPAEAEAVRVACIKELLDRGYGRAPLLIEGDADRPHIIRFEWGNAKEETFTLPEAAVPIIEAAVQDDAADADAEPPLIVTWADGTRAG
jgi:hypothetical protein